MKTILTILFIVAASAAHSLFAQAYLDAFSAKYRDCAECDFFSLEGNFTRALFEQDNQDDDFINLLRNIDGVEFTWIV